MSMIYIGVKYTDISDQYRVKQNKKLTLWIGLAFNMIAFQKCFIVFDQLVMYVYLKKQKKRKEYLSCTYDVATRL